MSENHGATPEAWDHFAFTLDLIDDLMPVVSNPAATISPESKMKAVGKTPSFYNRKGHVIGISGWTAHHSDVRDIERWRANPDYGICIQTRNVRAIDCDIHDPQLAEYIHEEIATFTKSVLPVRRRHDSSKFLLAFTMPGDYQKRTILTEGGIIEFLATGQQFIAVGRHPSGAHYEWRDGLPENIPVLTGEHFERLWLRLAECFAIEPPKEHRAATKQQKLNEAIHNDPIAQHLYAQNAVRSAERDGRLHIVCPFESEHTSDSAESATTYFPALTGGYERGHFHCLHAHCEGKTRGEFLTALDYEEGKDDFDIIDEDTSPAVAGDEGETEAEVSTGSADRFSFESLEDFDKRKPPRWIIKGVLPEGALGFFFGESGSGKTFFAIDIALAVAVGGEWRGHKVNQGNVAYIAAEDAAGVGHRIRAYRRQHGLQDTALPLSILAASPNFTDKEDVKKVLRGLRDLGKVSVVFVDTWAQVTPGANENSGEDMGKALGYCNALHRATGAMIVLIHHSGKDASKGARGWSGMRGAADVMIEVNRYNDDREAVIYKQKNGTDGARFGFKLHTVVVGEDEDGDDITSCVIEHTRAKSKAERSAAEVKGPQQKLVMAMANKLLADDPMPLLDFLSAVADMMEEPAEGKRDTRKQHVQRTVDALAGNGLLVKNGDLLSLAMPE